MKRSLFVSVLVLFVGSVSAMDKSESNDFFSRLSPVAVERVITPLSHKDLDTADFGNAKPVDEPVALQRAFSTTLQKINTVRKGRSRIMSPLTISAEPKKTA